MAISGLSFPIKIGTRGSPLALAQAHETRARLMGALHQPENAFEIVEITTSGDRITDRPLSEAGGKGLFTKEIEQALLDGRIDLAVHSTKDMPTLLPEGLELAAYLPREDVRDCFISLSGHTLASLPEGARVGTSSLRRAAMLKHLRPDIEIVEFRGNVQTRLQKLAQGIADATLLAEAGLIRLGNPIAREILDPSRFVPAVGQGAVCVEARSDRPEILEMLRLVHDEATEMRVEAERAMLAMLDGSCHTPIAAYTQLDGESLSLRGLVLSVDGARKVDVRQETALGDEPLEAAIALGMRVGEQLLAQGAGALVEGGEREGW